MINKKLLSKPISYYWWSCLFYYWGSFVIEPLTYLKKKKGGFSKLVCSSNQQFMLLILCKIPLLVFGVTQKAIWSNYLTDWIYILEYSKFYITLLHIRTPLSSPPPHLKDERKKKKQAPIHWALVYLLDVQLRLSLTLNPMIFSLYWER